MIYSQASTDTTLTMQSLAAPDTVFIRSVFTAHQLQAGKLAVKPLEPPQPDWVPGILLACFILFAWSQVFYAKRVRQILRAPFSQRFINQLMRDGNLFRERISLALGIIYFLTYGLLLYEVNEQILQIRFPFVSGITLYAAIILAFFVFLILKVVVVRLLGTIFKTRETTYNYLLNMLIFALLTAPVMMAALVFILYLKIPALLYIMIGSMVLQFLFRFVRSFLIGVSLTKFSYLLLFVYLCTLEILPLLVIAKVLLSQTRATGG